MMVAPEEEALRTEQAVRRTATGRVPHRVLVVPAARRAGRRERAEEVRRMAAEGRASRTDLVEAAVEGNSRPVVVAEEEDTGLQEAADSSPGPPLVALRDVSKSPLILSYCS